MNKITKEEIIILQNAGLSQKQIDYIEFILEKYEKSLSCLKDLVGDPLVPTDLFFKTMKKYDYLLSNDPKEAIPKKDIIIRKLFLWRLIKLVSPLCTKSVMQVENRNELLGKNEKDKGIIMPKEPVILMSNHHFRDDAITPLKLTNRPYYIMFGSIPQLYNSIDGLFGYLIGSVLVNRKVKESKKASLEKAKRVLSLGSDIIIYPEGTWNKTPEKLVLDFWPGVYKLAKETGAKIVPIINYVKDTTQKTNKKSNPIHLVIDEPIDVSSMNEAEAMSLLRDKIASWYYLMMEKYGQSTRDEILNGFENQNDAWEDVIEKLNSHVVVLDSDVEHISFYKKYTDIEEVYEVIANIEITKENAREVTYARKLVKDAKQNNYQKRL